MTDPEYTIEGDDKLLHMSDGSVIRGPATDAEMRFFKELKQLRDAAKLNEYTRLMVGVEATDELTKLPQGEWPEFLGKWIETVTKRLVPSDDDLREEARALCAGAYQCPSCRKKADQAVPCGAARDIYMALCRARGEPVAQITLDRLLGPTRAKHPDGSICDVCVVCGTLLMPGPPPRCEGCPDPEELEDDELHVPRSQW